MRIHNTILWLNVILVLGVVNYQIVRKEMVLNEGQTIFLELGPRDPRSLMQGDYMALRYQLPDVLRSQTIPDDGLVVFEVDHRQVATITRVHTPENPLKTGEYLLRYQRRDGRIQFGSQGFFFQEGHAEDYVTARFGELRVSPSGESVLIGLRDEHLNSLGPPQKPPREE